MSLEERSVGTLSEKPFAHLLLWAVQHSFTGVLVLARDDVKKSIVFDKGKLISARSNIPTETLGTLLLKDGKITAAQLEQSLKQIEGKEALKQGEVLLSMGLLNHAELNDALERQLLQRVYEVFGWDDGKYGFVPQVPEEAARIPFAKSLAEVCFRGLLKKYKHNAAPEIDPASKPAAVGGQAWDIHQLKLSGKEMSLYRMVNGVNSAAEILASGRLDGAGARAMLLALRDMELLRVDEIKPAALPEQPEKAPESRETETEKKPEPAAEKPAPLSAAALRGKTHFEILGLERNATSKQIKEAYFRLAKQYHPDKAAADPDGADRKEMEDVFARISQANTILSGEETRKEYEASLDLRKSGTGDAAEASRILQSEMEYQKAVASVRKGDFDAASAAMEKAFGLYDQEPEYWMLSGWILFRQGSKAGDAARVKKGKGQIEKAIAGNKKLSQAFFYLGMIQKSEGNTEEAARNFEKTLQSSPHHPEALSELRVINMRKAKQEKGGLKNLFRKKKE